MDDITTQAKLRSARDEIFALARQHGITYTPTQGDELAAAMSRLAGDDGELDEAGQLVLALQRAGHITSAEANHLHAEYLRAKYE